MRFQRKPHGKWPAQQGGGSGARKIEKRKVTFFAALLLPLPDYACCAGYAVSKD